jgi:hypothetical protein
MDAEHIEDKQQNAKQENLQSNPVLATISCVAGLLIPGLGHALLKKWTRALVFFFCISIMVTLGLQLHGQLYGPEFKDIFSTLQFISEAGSGLLYWVPFIGDFSTPNPRAYTFDFANRFLYVAGLLNMLIVIDAFDISLGRKK